jgi:hypothetical protein
MVVLCDSQANKFKQYAAQVFKRNRGTKNSFARL